MCKSLRRMTAKVDKRGRNRGQDMRVQSGSRMGIMAVAQLGDGRALMGIERNNKMYLPEASASTATQPGESSLE